jgi:hypothetical protein
VVVCYPVRGGMKIAQLLRIRLEFTQPTALRFFHGPALYAFLMDRLGNPARYPRGPLLFPVETGRCVYEPGDAYHFGLGVTSTSDLDADEILQRLAGPPLTEFGQTDGAPFGRNMRLVGVWDCVAGRPFEGAAGAAFLERKHVERAAEGLVGRLSVGIRFDGVVQIRKGEDRIFDGGLFETTGFFSRVLKAPENRSVSNPFPKATFSDARVAANHLVRLDPRYTKKLNGAGGSVELEFGRPLDKDSACALLLGGILGVGQATNMGLGRYSVVDSSVCAGWPPPPALTLCERAARPENRARVAEALRRQGKPAAVRPDDWNAFWEHLPLREEFLAKELAEGRWQPGAGDSGKLSAGMDDRFLQNLCAAELEPAVHGILDGPLPPPLPARKQANFVCSVPWPSVRSRLAACFRDDPMVDLLMRRVQAPVVAAGRLVPRKYGLPPHAPTTRLLLDLLRLH